MLQENKTGLASPHAITADEVLAYFKTVKVGLSSGEVATRRKTGGFNELPTIKRIHPLYIFLKQFKNTLVYILFLAAGISWWFEHIIDVYVILGVVVLNAIIGFFQEYRAEKAIEALKKIIVAQAKVYRDGEMVQIPARELVAGDIILLEEGDRVPADARLIETKALRAVESSLTGESMPVEKHINILPEKITLADRVNMVWMSTFVAGGTAKAVVTAIGKDTAIGDIATTLENIEKGKGHFEEKTEHLVRQMALIAVAGAGLTFIVGFFVRKMEFVEIFLFSVANLVSAIPEGLPAVLTIVLAVGAYKMSKRKAIIRVLPVTEVLGVTNVIITDKTGTLTENVMKIDKLVLPCGDIIAVGGSGWSATGSFTLGDQEIQPLENKDLDRLLHIGFVSNNARLKRDAGEVGAKVVGDPTEAAFIVLAEKAGLKGAIVEASEKRLDDQSFSSDLKYRASLVAVNKDGLKKYVYAVGAPEAILTRSTHALINGKGQVLDSKETNFFTENIKSMARETMRVIALAYREVPDHVTEVTDGEVHGLTVVGLVGMIDPPRSEAKAAIEKARLAGIRVIMATGDHIDTARAISQKIGLTDAVLALDSIPAFTGQELDELTEEKFDEAVLRVSVFARLTPNHKMRIASTLQKHGFVVAMTGDGVNDAPALKKADVGISMGITGTDVARDSSHMVLADDNFASILSAVEEGRVVFINIRNSAYYLLTTNFAEMATLLLTLFLGFPLPLLPIHVLWLNLVTDGFNTIGLAVEPGPVDTMQTPPKSKNEPLLGKSVLPFLLTVMVIMAVATIGVFKWYLPSGLDKARTAAFVIMSLTQIFNVANMRSLNRSIFSLGFFSNRYATLCTVVSFVLLFGVIYIPFFQKIFKFSSLGALEITVMILISSAVLWVGELYKFLKKR